MIADFIGPLQYLSETAALITALKFGVSSPNPATGLLELDLHGHNAVEALLVRRVEHNLCITVEMDEFTVGAGNQPGVGACCLFVYTEDQDHHRQGNAQWQGSLCAWACCGEDGIRGW